MKDFLGVFVMVLAGIYAGGFLSSLIREANLIRDCSLTSTHIIDSNTVIVCKVLKVRQTETVFPNNTKPEITL